MQIAAVPVWRTAAAFWCNCKFCRPVLPRAGTPYAHGEYIKGEQNSSQPKRREREERRKTHETLSEIFNDLREPLGIGMKRLMIALTIILGIVIVTAAGWLLWSRIGMAYARNKVSDTYLQNQPAYQSFVADRDDYAYRVRYTTFYTPSDALTEMGVEKIYEEVGSCICFEQAWRALGGIPQGILYAPDTEEVPSWYHRVQLDNDWYYYWIPG